MIQTSHRVNIIDNCSQKYILISVVTPLFCGLVQETEADDNDAGACQLWHLSSVHHKTYRNLLVDHNSIIPQKSTYFRFLRFNKHQRW